MSIWATVPVAKGQHRAFTELEILNRDHNWRQGQLRRLYLALDILKDEDNKAAAKLAVEAESIEARKEYEAAREKFKGPRNP